VEKLTQKWRRLVTRATVTPAVAVQEHEEPGPAAAAAAAVKHVEGAPTPQPPNADENA